MSGSPRTHKAIPNFIRYPLIPVSNSRTYLFFNKNLHFIFSRQF